MTNHHEKSYPRTSNIIIVISKNIFSLESILVNMSFNTGHEYFNGLHG